MLSMKMTSIGKCMINDVRVLDVDRSVKDNPTSTVQVAGSWCEVFLIHLSLSWIGKMTRPGIMVLT